MNYVACIAEGAAETAIIDILVDHHLLIFEREQMLDEQVLRCRNASTFESRYLRKGFSGKITVYRILDSRRERFRLSKAYEHKVDVINVVTAPEIEMLIILNENRYDDFKKSGMKPSAYCTIVLPVDPGFRQNLLRWADPRADLLRLQQDKCRLPETGSSCR